MRIRIEGNTLPGSSCGPSPERPDGHHNIHVAVQGRGGQDDLLDMHRGDESDAVWEFDAEISGRPGGDLRSRYIHGRPGQRFIYLSWGVVDSDGFHMFRRAKLRLDDIPADVLTGACDAGVLVARLALTNPKGQPVCAAVRPPLVEWGVGSGGRDPA